MTDDERMQFLCRAVEPGEAEDILAFLSGYAPEAFDRAVEMTVKREWRST